MSIALIFRKYALLLLSVLLLAAGAVDYFFLRSSPAGSENEYYSQRIQEKIIRELGVSGLELAQVGVKYQNSSGRLFNDLSMPAVYPYYVFRNGQLIYWSDFRFVPDYRQLSKDRKVQVIKTTELAGLVSSVDFRFRNDTIEVYSLIPLCIKYPSENDYLKSGFNKAIFDLDPKQIALSPGVPDSHEVRGGDGTFLFSFVSPDTGHKANAGMPESSLWLFSLAMLALVGFVFTELVMLVRQHQFEKAFIILLLSGVLIRWIMLITGIPVALFSSDLFNPALYNGGYLSPTLGDVIINAFFLVIFLVFISAYHYRSATFFDLLKGDSLARSVVSVLTVVVSILLSYLGYKFLGGIYEHSGYTLSFSLSLSFSGLKIATLFYYVLCSCIFFFGIHVCVHIFLRINSSHRSGFFHWLYGFILGLIILLFKDEFRWIYLIAGGYFWLVYYFKLSRFFYTLRMQTSVYYILGSFVFALIAVDVVTKEEQRKSMLDKREFGNRYLAENDVLGEGMLSRYMAAVKRDTAVSDAFARQSLAYESVRQLIRDKHMELYFDKYDTEIHVFDGLGRNMDTADSSGYLEYYERNFRRPEYRTSIPDVYFRSEAGYSFIKQYVTFSDITRGGVRMGTIVLNMILKDAGAESIYPELLLDKKYAQNPESRSYSYGLFSQSGKLIFSSGSFNYQMKFSPEALAGTELFNAGILQGGYRHLGIKGSKGRIIVVSSQDRFVKTAFSNFSFLFLLSVLCISIVMLFYALKYGTRNLSMNFSTKVQLYLNSAFLLPLIVVVVLTLSIVKSTFVYMQEKAFIDNTKNIASTVQLQAEGLTEKKMSRPFFEQEINDLARDTKVDINYFSDAGRLVYSTRPLVYQYRLLSDYINPEAYRKIIEDKENEALFNESLGLLNYKTVYINLKGKDNNSLGVVGIPFFDARETLDRQVTEVVTTILSVFLVLFLILLILSYFASNQLTNPLKFIAMRLKKTNLDRLNEPLDWRSDDEIGVLTKSYNNMLKQLEESKVALSQSEKQTAWREMAKQVAHEIKNPLTPMKLSIQQLQRTLPTDDPKARERIERALNSLTEQIDNISEIANSFSEFAKMPIPRNERFDIVPVVRKTADLYAQNNDVSIEVSTMEEHTYVTGDRQLLGRVVANLILNGIQSVPPTRKPHVMIRLYRNEEENFAIMEVKDNGAGIPESVRKKVFIPNFSTKVGGSGLGLAMAKRGIEHAGGNIWFETVEDEGTTFFVDLPIAD